MAEYVECVFYPDGRMDTKNAARYVGLSVKTLAMMRCAGTGPDWIKRGKVFYFKEDLDAWLEEGRRKSMQRTSDSPSFVPGN